MALSSDSKWEGLSAMSCPIKGSAYNAVPSTTSITKHPATLSSFSTFVKVWTTLQAIDPPRLWPTITTFLSGNISITAFSVAVVKAQSDSIASPSSKGGHFEYPCAGRSNATRVAKCLTSLANAAKLRADSPAPWTQKNRAPACPALNKEVPYVLLFKYVWEIGKLIEVSIPIDGFIITMHSGMSFSMRVHVLLNKRSFV